MKNMKQLLLILAMVVSSITFSQDLRVAQAYTVQLGDWNEEDGNYDFREIEKSEVTIEIVKTYLFFDNNISTVIRTISDARVGDGYFSWDAIDDRGVECSLMMYVEEEPYSIVILYETFCVVYNVTF